MIQSPMKQFLTTALLLVLCGFIPALKAQTAEQEQLWTAIENDDYKTVKSLIKEGVTLNEIILQKNKAYSFFISRQNYLQAVGRNAEETYVYMTPLQFAALKNRFKIAKYMLKKKANMDAGDSQGKVALMYALWQPGGEELALYFLKRGANYIARDNAGNTALHYAALGGNPKGIHMTYGGGININDRNADGMTPFHAAAQAAKPEILQQLADMGADVLAVDSMGMDALHYASAYGKKEGLEWLVAHGLNPNTIAKTRFSALDIATYAENKENIAYLKSIGARFNRWRVDELLQAAEDGSTSIVRDLLNDGVNPNCEAKDYALHISARKGDLKTLEWLLKGGANPSLQNAAGLTPFQEAFQHENAGVAITLLENGSEIKNEWVAEIIEKWSLAGVKSPWEELIKRVLEKTSDSNIPGGSENLTALDYAARAGSPEVVAQLLKSGATPSIADDKGWTALHWLCVGTGAIQPDAKKVEVAKALVKAGAKVNAETEKPRKISGEKGKPAELYPPHSTPLDVLDNNLREMPLLAAYFAEVGAPRMLTAGDYLAIGGERLKESEFSLAMRDFSRAITANPAYGEGYLGRGKALVALKMYKEALRDLEVAVKKMPNNAEAWYHQAAAQFELKNHKGSLESAKKAVQLDPEMVDAYWYQGQSFLALGAKPDGCNSFVDGANKGSDRCRKSYDIHCR